MFVHSKYTRSLCARENDSNFRAGTLLCCARMHLQDLQHIAVIGAGQMGQGIAQVCADKGFAVALCDVSLQQAQAGVSRVQERLQQAVQRGKLSAEAAAAAAQRLVASEPQPGVSTAQLVIEAVSEQAQLKQQLFRQLDSWAPADCVLCSNTSSISIELLGAATQRPSQVLGMHFMNPVPTMKLLELIRSPQTSDASYTLVRDLGLHLGKQVVTSQDRPGFIVNRILIPQLNEACLALEEGVASIEDIDAAITLGLNHPMGPLRLSDWIGLDTVLSICQVLHEQFAQEKYRPSALLQRLVQAGHLGFKAGRGFYVYENGKPVAPNTLPG